MAALRRGRPAGSASGQMCTCMSYRNPAYLAKVAATIDIISEGRVEMGIGAGLVRARVARLRLRLPDRRRADRPARRGRRRSSGDLWTTGTATLQGKHYQVDGAICRPRPLQGTTRPGSALNGIPMWIAGGGEKKTLRIAAEYADYTNFDGALEGFKHKSEVLRGHCADVGRDFDEIVRSRQLQRRDRRDRAGGAGPPGLDPRPLPQGRSVRAGRRRADRPACAPAARSGTPEQIVENLSALAGARG